MWLEIKAVITVIGCFVFAIILGLSGNLVFVILGIIGMSTMIFGDLLFGWKTVSTDAIHLIDPTGPGEKIIDLYLIGGGRRFIKGTKGPLGKYEFVYQKHKASVIDDGRYPIRFPNGNPGVVAHESYDKNIDFYKAKLLEELFEIHNVDNIKDLYPLLKQAEEKDDGKK